MPNPLARIRATGLSLERAVKQHRWLWRYGHCQRVMQTWMAQRRGVTTTASRRCLLDLRRIAVDGEQGRRFHTLVMLLQRGGFELSMVPRLQFMQTGHRAFKASALSQIQPFFQDQLGEDFRPFDLCLTDSGRPCRLAHRTLEVVTSTRHALDRADLPVPYGFFPAVWDQRQDELFDQHRARRRVWRFFFGGNCSRGSYEGIRKYTRLQTVNRHRVVSEVNRYFNDSTLVITSDEQLESASKQRHESFVMIDNAIYRPGAERWLSLLSQSDFFLAAPGCDYPLSHNAIESIAVGTIPVLEYGSLFSPALRDGENCIAYRGLDGLRSAVARIDGMGDDAIRQLRSRVVDYYETHLSPKAFCRLLDQSDAKRLHLFPYLAPEARRAA